MLGFLSVPVFAWIIGMVVIKLQDFCWVVLGLPTCRPNHLSSGSSCLRILKTTMTWTTENLLRHPCLLLLLLPSLFFPLSSPVYCIPARQSCPSSQSYPHLCLCVCVCVRMCGHVGPWSYEIGPPTRSTVSWSGYSTCRCKTSWINNRREKKICLRQTVRLPWKRYQEPEPKPDQFLLPSRAGRLVIVSPTFLFPLERAQTHLPNTHGWQQRGSSTSTETVYTIYPWRNIPWFHYVPNNLRRSRRFVPAWCLCVWAHTVFSGV